MQLYCGCNLAPSDGATVIGKCDLHKRLALLELQVSEQQDIVDAAVALVKWHGAGALQGERYAKLFSLTGNYLLGRTEKPFSDSEVKARLAQIENGKCPECGQKAHLHNCAEKRKCVGAHLWVNGICANCGQR